MSDPTKVTNQPALTSSTGRSWLILGGLLSGIAVAILVPMLTMKPAGIALFGIVAIVVLYAAMVVVRVGTKPGRRRLWLLAGSMLAIALTALVCIIAVAASVTP